MSQNRTEGREDQSFRSTGGSLGRALPSRGAQFCGHEAGPRTIFTIDATCAYDIAPFSHYGDTEAEVRRYAVAPIAPTEPWRWDPWACTAHGRG